MTQLSTTGLVLILLGEFLAFLDQLFDALRNNAFLKKALSLQFGNEGVQSDAAFLEVSRPPHFIQQTRKLRFDDINLGRKWITQE